jgi:hypothetical protein
VLLPDLLCQDAVRPFAASGVDIARYPVGERLEVRPEAVAGALTAAVRAVVVPTYFGLPQPYDALAELCRGHGALLVDDASHGALSEDAGRPLGTLGDVGMVSVHKALGTGDGAILWRREGDRPVAKPPAAVAGRAAPRAQLARVALWSAERALGSDVLGARGRRLAAAPDPAAASDDDERAGWSWLCERVVARTDLAAARELRWAAFARWPALLVGAGVEAVWSGALPFGSGPIGFPVRVRDAAAFRARMEELRVEWMAWPDVPAPCVAFPDGVAVLPTHVLPGG